MDEPAHGLNPSKVGARVECRQCGRTKLPIGRSAPAELYSSRCNRDCSGYDLQPYAGSLWPDETEAEFGYLVSDEGTRILE